MKNFRIILTILVVSTIFTIIIAIIINNNNNELKQLNKLYSNQANIIKNSYIDKSKNIKKEYKKQIQTLKHQSTTTLDTLTHNIKNQSQNLIAINNKLLSLNKNLTIYQQQSLDTFIAERTQDLLFLSRITLRQRLLTSFYHTSKLNNTSLYKEVVYFNLKGKEIYKKSSIEVLKMNISKKENTYCKKEIYFNQIKDLQEGETYLSKPISCKDKQPIIKMITPIYRKFKKVGFLSVALDTQHIDKIKQDFKKVTKE